MILLMLALKDKNLDSLHSNLITELNNIRLWVKANKISINNSKTNYKFFKNRSVKNSINPVLLDGQVIQHVTDKHFWCHHR